MAIIACVAWYKHAKEKAQIKTIEACKIYISTLFSKGLTQFTDERIAYCTILSKTRSYIYSNNIDSPSNNERLQLEQLMVNLFWEEAFLQAIKKGLWLYFDIFDETSKDHIEEIINRVAPKILEYGLNDLPITDEDIVVMLAAADIEIEQEARTRAKTSLGSIRYSLALDDIESEPESAQNTDSEQSDFKIVAQGVDFQGIHNSIEKDKAKSYN